MIGRLRAWADDRRGAAAVEFALLLPLILGAQFAVGEFMQAYQAQRRVSHVAAAMADITSQSRALGDADLAEILNAAEAMIRPYDEDGLGLRIASLYTDNAGAVTVDWTVTRNNRLGGAPAVPSGYLAANESVIVADVTYDYAPAWGLFLDDGFRFTRHAYVRPRLSNRVERR